MEQVQFTLRRIQQGDSDLIMTHFDMVDEMGHIGGWPADVNGSEWSANLPYISQLRKVDEQVRGQDA